MPFDDNEIETRLTERFARHARDFDDLQNEMAGRDVGRISRFLSADAQDAKEPEKREERRASMLTALQAALSNPAYAALFVETQRQLNDAQNRLDAMAQQVAAEIARSEEALDEKLDNAASLPDGTKVFKDRNGDVRTQDGAVVSAELAATIIWQGDEPNYEDFQAEADRLERLKNIDDDVRAGQAEIGDMQAAMIDESEAETTDELDGFRNRANDIADSLEGDLENTLLVSAPANETSQTVGRTATPIVVPEL